ncbi:NADP-dependent oxidoreductase [Actinomadura spongiicola]|uniref:NADP-dependent oxidoreductase n=1 Tax=Actinomadura spongiicola TaxID=2303421 RepID=A0A372GNZ1_9ACTN|nr:NADP-dependent oxidoreductase [Actinomadura spongiicola]RFS87045.1 NADP-dependent oxidoreductase [Actinomadura spongiicola]
MTVNREIHLLAHPKGEPHPAIFELVTTALPEPAEGQILVRNTWMSVDPYMRERMHVVDTYLPPLQLGEALDGPAIGEVVASRSADIPVGATVVHWLGWRDYAVVDPTEATVVDLDVAPAEHWLGVLGTTGLTAYAALTQVAPVREGDIVFVSTAAGAVGTIAGQLARKLGASRVIGSTGDARKAKKLVEDFGYDAAIDYRAAPIAAQLAEAAPDGIDVYLDNVGGDHLTAAIDALRDGGRIAMVGAISTYNATEPVPGPSNLFHLAPKDATLRGMLINTYFPLFPEWIDKATNWLADGSLHTEVTVAEGLEAAPTAFLDLMRGGNIGKMLVRL